MSLVEAAQRLSVCRHVVTRGHHTPVPIMFAFRLSQHCTRHTAAVSTVTNSSTSTVTITLQVLLNYSVGISCLHANVPTC